MPLHGPHPRSLTRRSLLQAGGIGLLGLGMADVAALRAAASPSSSARPKSVIYIFLSGGLSQHDSFDMKPDAPQDIRGEFSPIRTNTPGLHICEHLPELAKRSHLWSLCRSLGHDWNEHSQGHAIMLGGRSELGPAFSPQSPRPTDPPSIATLAKHLLKPRANLPAAVVLPEKIVHRTGRVIPGQFAGMLGQRNDPFLLELSRYNPNAYGAYPTHLFHHATGKKDAAGIGFKTPNFSLPQGVGIDRLKDRLALSKHLDAQQAHLERAAAEQGADRFQEMAVSLLSDPQTKAAFDVHSADPKLQDCYGRNLFGWSLLLARQLVESGVSMIQVNLGNNETWDNHQAIFPNLKNFLLPPMDKAVAALLDDLDDRGMLDDTLVVMAGEFGRTPKITKLANTTHPGRDHWGAAQSVLFAGAGTGGGRVIGSTDAIGAHPKTDPQRPENFAATIYHHLGIPHDTHWTDLTGRPHRLYGGAPIPGLGG
ncbi:MAG: DUF1501 domain-containing protein [Verrucomicrobiales bacterium]|nr:DUF1501 domain-containing protein [Verrucomicrobiales bacterium]